MPTITIIWMADDNLGFTDDYISYALYPEETVEFIKDDILWESGNIKKLDSERQKVLTLLNNHTKNFDFLPKNRLIYAFQKNIVQNKKLKKYFDWFEFAEKTRNKNNIEADFELYKKNPTFMAVMERIETKKFVEEELSALEALERELALSAIWRMGLKEEMTEELTPALRKELTAVLKLELTPQIREQGKMETVIAAYKQGLSVDIIVAITQLDIKKVIQIIENDKLTKL